MERYDAVIVGARCAGATAALELARGGRKVLMLDREQLPAPTLSTHGVWPNTLARLDELGVLELLAKRHTLHPLSYRIRVLGHESAGPWTEIDGHSLALCPRREALDAAITDTAIAAGAEARFGEAVAGLIGTGTEGDPVRGVVTGEGERIEAPWVIGADGRASTVARALGLEGERPLAGEMAMLFAYWQGLPANKELRLQAERDSVVMWGQAEDDLQMIVLNGRPEITRGGDQARTATYLEGIRGFAPLLEPEWLDDAERVSRVWTAPETMLRGFFRRPSGPGWALAGDACHFKHPATAQGISDATEQGIYVARGLLGDDPDLEGYAEWRDRRADEHYEWSFDFARFPRDAAHVLFGALEHDEQAAQDFRDTLSRLVLPRSELFTEERLASWFATAS